MREKTVDTQTHQNMLDKLVDALILEVLRVKGSVERNNFKKIIYDLTDRFYKKGMLLPLDFRVYNEEIESNALDDALLYLTSSCIVEKVHGSVVYKLSETVKSEGIEKFLNIIYKGIPVQITKDFKKEVENYCTI